MEMRRKRSEIPEEQPSRESSCEVNPRCGWRATLLPSSVSRRSSVLLLRVSRRRSVLVQVLRAVLVLARNLELLGVEVGQGGGARGACPGGKGGRWGGALPLLIPML